MRHRYPPQGHWDWAIETGRSLERSASFDARLTATETQLEKLSAEVSTMRLWSLRAGLLVALWVSATGLNLKAETTGELLAAFVKAMIK